MVDFHHRNRVVRDVALLSLSCTVIGCGIVLIVFAIGWFLLNSSSVDRAHILGRIPWQLTIAAFGGAILGLFAGLASRLPPVGFSIVWCCFWIGLASGIVRFVTEPHPKVSEAEQHYFSYISTLAAGLIATATLIWLGHRRRSARAGGVSPPQI